MANPLQASGMAIGQTIANAQNSMAPKPQPEFAGVTNGMAKNADTFRNALAGHMA